MNSLDKFTDNIKSIYQFISFNDLFYVVLNYQLTLQEN